MLDLLLQCLGIIRSFYFLWNTVVHKSHCVQDLISLWHNRKCRKAKLNTVLFPALLGLCVSAVQQALLWAKRGEQRYWLSLLKDDILKWAVKIKRNVLFDFQTLIYYMTNMLIYQQSKKTFLKLHFSALFWVFYCDSIASALWRTPRTHYM